MLSHARPWISKKFQPNPWRAWTRLFGGQPDRTVLFASQSPPFADVTTHAGRWPGCDGFVQRNLRAEL
jgi:hypothetical protein